MGRMYFRYGAMGASKTAQALITQYNYQERGLNVLLIKPAMDTRDGVTTLRSRIGLASEAIVVAPEDDVFTLFVRGSTREDGTMRPYDVVIADESQFLTPTQVEQLRNIVDTYDVPVFCYGLRTDFQTHLFPGSKRILELTDEMEEIKTVCDCGRKAVVNARLVNGKPVFEGDQVMLGGNESYIAMCHKCWNKARMGSQIHTSMSEKMKQRFVKDMNLPIKDFDDLTFNALLEQYEDQFGAKSAYDVFIESAKQYESDEAYLDAYDAVQDKAIQYLQENNPYMETFVDTISKKPTPAEYKYPSKDIYRPSFADRVFMSFDMKKANFNALRHFDARIVGNKPTYEEFVGMFTDDPHILHSKRFRTVVFGKANPKQVSRYETMLMNDVTDEILKYFAREDIIFKSTDEVIVEIKGTPCEPLLLDYALIGKKVVEEMAEEDILIRCEIFKLMHIPGKGFIKQVFYGEKPYVPKGVSAADMPDIITLIKAMPTDHFVEN